MTGLYGVIGDPVAHSLSPLIHKGWLRTHGFDADYLAMQVPAGELSDTLTTLSRRSCRGINITLPHKETALELAKEATPRAKAIGAANTLWRVAGDEWHAANTDAPGFLAALNPLIKTSIKGRSVLVLGAGGAARAIVYALNEAGAQITLANRTLTRALNLLAAYADCRHRARTLEEGVASMSEFDIVINTTSLGHQTGSTFPDLPAGKGRLFYDISYGKAADRVLEPARQAGWRTEDGLSMLVWQAAFTFERWFGILPEIEKAHERCRRTLEAVT